MNKFLSYQFMLLPALITPLCLNAAQKKEEVDNKPNVLFIMIDDFGQHQMGCYGSTYYETPNIDRLSENGMKFSNAYAAASVSSATRACLMTGQYPARTHLTDWLNGYSVPQSYNLSLPNWKKGLDDEQILLPQVFQDAGYYTSLIGKWHLAKNTPGFDEIYRFDGPKASDDAAGDCHRAVEYTDSAISLLKRCKDGDKPFFLYLSHNSIHTPESEVSSLIDKYAAKQGSLQGGMLNPTQGAMVERLDNETGRLFDYMEQNGFMDNTIIIFYADNGQYSPKEKVGAAPYRGSKVTLWEGGVKEPLLVYWKNKIKPNTVCEEQVSSQDFLPTLMELCNLEDSRVTDIDGLSFAPNLLDDPQHKLNREYLCWHYPHYHAEASFIGSIRKGDWKLIENMQQSLYGNEGAFELYNLADDPMEANNLCFVNPSKAQELYHNLCSWRDETGAQMPLLNDVTAVKELFHFVMPEVATKANMFHQQGGLSVGLQYDGNGTCLKLEKNAYCAYFVQSVDADTYKFKAMCRPANMEDATIEIKVSGKVVSTINVPASESWKTIEIDIPLIPNNLTTLRLTVTSGTLLFDKFVLTTHDAEIEHDGNADDTDFYSSNSITFADDEEKIYSSITGNAQQQEVTPTIVDNPIKDEVNATNKCLYIRSAQDLTNLIPKWAANACVITLKESIEITEKNRYLHILHNKGQKLNQWLIYGSSDNGATYVELGRGNCETPKEWFDMVVDVSSKLSSINRIKILMDGNWTGSGADRYYAPTDFYYDEIIFTNSSAQRTNVTSGIVQIGNSGKDDIKVFPNPVADILTINADDDIESYSIYSTVGSMVDAECVAKSSNDVKVDVSHLLKGVYILNVKIGNKKMESKKFIKL